MLMSSIRAESSFTGFCAESVSKSRTSNTWMNQLLQISGVSEPIARAILRVYPTFASLMQLYECEGMTEKAKMNLLANLEREDSGTGAARRLGPSLSKKIYSIFNDLDGTKLVQDL